MKIALAKLWLAQLRTLATHAFGALARAPALFFRLELADTIVYKTTTAFNFTFLFMNVGT